jgi:hypothetical protein
MKIAIQGHSTRGKEVIQILESLGGINSCNHSGSNPACYYEIHGNTIVCVCTKSNSYKYYILDEFKKEFPLKVGDIILLKGLNKPCEILALEWYMDKLYYKLDNGLHYDPKTLTPYAEMKKERNITLTLDKAKEWYNKGGELKEIALQAFTEKELNPLPRSWEEFIESTKFTFNGSLEYINGFGQWSNGCLPNKSIGESSKIWDKHVALFQLEQLRNCWIQNRTYEWDDHSFKYQIKFVNNRYEILALKCVRNFLSFPTREMAEEFLECFRDLIEKARDLI